MKRTSTLERLQVRTTKNFKGKMVESSKHGETFSGQQILLIEGSFTITPFFFQSTPANDVMRSIGYREEARVTSTSFLHFVQMQPKTMTIVKSASCTSRHCLIDSSVRDRYGRMVQMTPSAAVRICPDFQLLRD